MWRIKFQFYERNSQHRRISIMFLGQTKFSFLWKQQLRVYVSKPTMREMQHGSHYNFPFTSDASCCCCSNSSSTADWKYPQHLRLHRRCLWIFREFNFFGNYSQCHAHFPFTHTSAGLVRLAFPITTAMA